MQPGDLGWLLALSAAAWFWFDTQRAREHAVRQCRAACTGRGLQLLDDTVALELLRTARDPAGRLRLRRRYRFDFTRDGAARATGTVVMLGEVMELLEFPLDGAHSYEQLH